MVAHLARTGESFTEPELLQTIVAAHRLLQTPVLQPGQSLCQQPRTLLSLIIAENDELEAVYAEVIRKLITEKCIVLNGQDNGADLFELVSPVLFRVDRC